MQSVAHARLQFYLFGIALAAHDFSTIAVALINATISCCYCLNVPIVEWRALSTSGCTFAMCLMPAPS